MQNKLVTILKKYVFPAAFWLGIWQIAATVVDREFLLPGIPATLKALADLLVDRGFYIAVALSALRVALGLLLGIIFGIILAFVCRKFGLLDSLFSPAITVIKSTPVASFILLLWVLMSGDALSIFIGFLMVMPIIYQNVSQGISAIDPQLDEVCRVFRFSFSKRLRLLVLPTVKTYLYPAIITASGLAWKAEIAAEVIAYTKDSIGQGINDAKYNMETPTVFAWTLVIVLLSVLLEKCTRSLFRRTQR